MGSLGLIVWIIMISLLGVVLVMGGMYVFDWAGGIYTGWVTESVDEQKNPLDINADETEFK